MRRRGRRRKNKRSIWAPNVQYVHRTGPHSQVPWFVAVLKTGGLRNPSSLTSFKEPMNSPADPMITVLLVHGAWADASSWRKVIPLLHRAGIPVVAVQNPTSSLADDVAATRAALENVQGPVVLAGHSWGGTVITEAGNDPKVKALVFVAAFAPEINESTGDQVAAHPAPPGLATVAPDRSGNLVMSVEGFLRNVAQAVADVILEAVRPVASLEAQA